MVSKISGNMFFLVGGVEKRVDFNMKMQKGVVFFFVYVCVCVCVW